MDLLTSMRAGGSWSKILITAGPPGNRNDLVAGWLSNNCENFYPNGWMISPVWGKSEVCGWWNIVQLIRDHDSSSARQLLLNQIQNEIDFNYHLDAPMMVIKSHLTSGYLEKFFPESMWEKFLVIDIIVAKSEAMQVHWENFVKGFLCQTSNPIKETQLKLRCKYALGNQYTGNIVEDISNVYNQWELNFNDATNTSTTNKNFPAILVDYQELMQPDGIDYLEFKLNLKRKPIIHLEWSECVRISTVPPRVWALGREWVKFDIR